MTEIRNEPGIEQVTLDMGVLGRAASDVPIPLLAEHLARHYRLKGELTPLTGERDRNYRLLIDGEPKYVVKVAHPEELAATIEAQSLAANHVRSLDASLPVQRVSLTESGNVLSVLRHAGEDRLVRVVDWLPGRVMATASLTLDVATSIGSTLARLGRALRGYDNPHASQDLLWDLSNAGRLRQLLPNLRGDPLHPLVEEALAAYDSVLPELDILPRQAIHADFNPHNILVDEASTRVVGVLDFGDMQIAPPACDLAIACAYLTGPANAPFAFVEAAVTAYHREYPLGRGDAPLLVDLIAMRHAMTILITEWRARRHPESAAYILRNNPAARRGLTAFSAGGREALLRTLAAALNG